MNEVVVNFNLDDLKGGVVLPSIGLFYNLASLLRFPFITPSQGRPTILDIGACVGNFTIAVKRLLPNAVIHAFEPYPPAWPYFLRNTQGLSDIRLHKIALGNRNGRLKLSFSKGYDDMSQASAYGDEDNPLAWDVPVMQLDRMSSGAPGLVKIDVEGYEAEVIRGGEKMLREYHPMVVLEIKKHHQQRAGGSPDALIDLMASLGYGPPNDINGHDFFFEKAE